jgi:hypothetical protein
MKSEVEAFKRQARELRERLKRGARSGVTHNVAARTNVVVAKNVGTENASQGASARQRTRIRLQGGETYEETETTKTMS